MKRILAILLAVAMLCTVVPFGALVSAAEGNLVENGDFEDGTTSGWATYNKTTISIDNQEVGSGQYSARVEMKDDWALTHFNATLTPNTDYVLIFKAKSSNGYDFNINMQRADWSDVVQRLPVDAQDTWTEHRLEFNSGSEGALMFHFQSGRVAADNHVLWLDDVILVEKANAPAIPEEVVEGNLITNPGFESGAEGWTLGENVAVVTDDKLHSGSSALKVDENGSSVLMMSQKVAVKPNTDYVVSVWYYCYANAAVNAAYFFDVDGANPDYAWEGGTFVDQGRNRVYPGSALNTWNQAILKFNTGSSEEVTVRLSNYRADGGQYYFDDIALVEYGNNDAPDEPPVPDALITNGDFETGDGTGWELGGSTVIGAEFGKNSFGVKLEGIDTWGNSLTVTGIAVEPNTEYVLSFDINGGTAGLYIQSNGANVLDPQWPGNNGGWATKEYSFNTGNYTSINISFNGCEAAAGVKYLDNIKLVKVIEPSNDGYIINGDFETGVRNNWTVNGTASINGEAAKDGNFGISFTGTGTWGDGFFQTFAVEPNTKYVLTYDIKTVEGGAGTLYVRGGPDKNEWAFTDDLDGNNNNLSSAGDWETQTVVFDSKSNTYVCVHFNGAAGGTHYFDNVSIAKYVEPEVPADDILKNGDFETGDTSSWVPMWDATTVMVAGHDSQYAAEVTATLWNSLAQEIRVEKNKEYTISFWAKKGSGAPNVSVLVKDVAGNQNINQAHMNNVTEEWEQFSFTFNAGECTNPTLLIMANADTGTVVVDDIVITKNEAEEPEEPEVPAGSNLVTGGDFETGALGEGWILSASGTSQSGISAEAAKDGKYGYLVSGTRWEEILKSNVYNLIPGSKYTVTFDAKSVSNSVQANFQVKHSLNANEVTGSNLIMDYPVFTEEWKTYTYSFDATGETHPYSGLLFVRLDGDFYIDNVRVTAENASGLLANGSFETGDAGWTLGENASVVTGEQARDGAAALKTNENGSSILMASQSVQLTPNTDYVVTGWFYFYGNIDTNPAYFFNVEGATPDYAWEYGTFKDRNDNRQYVNGAANAWVMTRLKFNSGDTGVVNVSLVNYRTDGGQYYFDDFKLVEYDESDYDGSGYVGNSNQEKAEGADIRVMSYNVLMDNAEYGGINWGQPMDKPFSGTGTRDGNAAIMIGHYAPDVIGFQEFSYNWYQGIRTALPQYEFVNDVDPESGNEDFMCTALAYNTETVELVESRLFKNTKTRWGVLRFRYVNAGIFRLKATGQMFIVTSLHPDAGEVNGDGLHRPHQLKEDAEFIKALEEEFRVPVISTGDYNSGSSADEFQTFMEITGMRDSNTKNGGSVIDHVMINSYVQSLYATTVTDAIVAGASDHLAVFSDLKLLDGASYSIDAILNNIKTQGRTEMVDGTLMLDWSISGIEFKANCSGTVKATFNAKKIGDTTAQGGVYFTIVVDGVAKDRAYCHITKAGETEIVLAEGLAAGEHTFAIYRQTEHQYGEVGISSISLDGTLAAKPADSDLYIEFIGDSITAAYGCLSNDVNQKDPGKPLYSDATQGYAYLTAKALGADWSSVAWSGLGCKYGYSSTTMQQVYPMQRYNYDKNTAYDFSARVPDIIVFALGTNDDAIQKDAALRKAGMVEMLNLVREKNPGVKIVWIYNMMTSGINKQIEEIINEMGGEEAGLYSLKLTMNTSGGGWHPNLAGQKKFADDLTAFIQTTFMKPPKQVTGMSIVTEPTKTQYQIGDKLDTTGLVLELTYDDGSTEQVTEGFTTRGFQSVTAGKRKVTVVYGDFSDSYQYEVVDNETPVDPPIDPPVDPAKNGWVEEDGKWAYYVDDVKVVNKWMLDSVGWCYVGADGYCVTNKWVADSKGWCYLDDQGRMVTNKWVKDSVGWCYIGEAGYCLTNAWVKDSVGWCYLDANGRMVYNTTVDGYYVNADGYRVG